MPIVTKSRNEEVLNSNVIRSPPQEPEIEKPRVYVPEELPEYTGPIELQEPEQIVDVIEELKPDTSE